jgi:predicted Zn-dependent peptidase
MTADQLRASWLQRLQGGLHIIVTGAVDTDAVTTALDAHLGGLDVVVAGAHSAQPSVRSGRYLVHQPEAPQSVIRLLAPGWNVNSEARCAATLGALVLGGTFTSRLNTILREEKGWTYGARLWLHSERHHGSRVLFQTSVVAEHTGDAVTILLEQLALAANEGITEAELGKATGASRTSVSALDSCGRACQALGSLAVQGLQPDAMQTRLAEVAATTAEQVNAALARIDASAGVLVVVGDRDTLTDQLPGTWTEVEPW